MPATRRLRNRSGLTAQHSVAAPNSTSRPRRAAAPDPRKLQHATRGQTTARGPRQGRKKAIVEETSEEEDDDEQTTAGYGNEDEDELSEEEDAEGEEDDDDMDAEAEDDEEMIISPPVRVSAPKGSAGKPQVKVTPVQELPSVEDKEMAMDEDEDDDELSELDDEDAEGEVDDDVGEEDVEVDESDEDISASASRGDTPDLSKLTRRQRGHFEDVDGSLLALSNEAQKKKHLTAEEHAMRRTEMARRRKNLSEKRNEEEKQDTINRLLKKQAPKRRSKAEKEADRIAEEEGDPDRIIPKAKQVYSRIIMSGTGTRLSIPEDWEGAPFGPFLESSRVDKSTRLCLGRLVEEVS